MTYKEVLEKAIEKAVDGGWDQWGWLHTEVDETALYITFANKKKSYQSAMFMTKEFKSVIFDHSFAKALWGDKQIGPHWIPYLWHLQQMVICDNPLTYLEENI